MTKNNAANGVSPYEVERFFTGHSRGHTVGKRPESGGLTEMYAMQAELDDRIVRERGIERDMSEAVIGLTIAMESEIDEIRREVNWKWWKNPKEIDVDALQGEVIDLWHFLLSMSRAVGLEPADIVRIYKEKNAENHDRQSGTSDKAGYKAT